LFLRPFFLCKKGEPLLSKLLVLPDDNVTCHNFCPKKKTVIYMITFDLELYGIGFSWKSNSY
jgi:hypothetical protein